MPLVHRHSYHRYRMRSFVYPQLGKSQFLRGNQIKLPQLGWLESVRCQELQLSIFRSPNTHSFCCYHVTENVLY
ncbi:hypothetical protein NIES2130_22060 [Scytonema sp. HK-05]|nr:hypothetical protein NIES2130_22060 [Scytonema sp. HK-05]